MTKTKNQTPATPNVVSDDIAPALRARERVLLQRIRDTLASLPGLDGIEDGSDEVVPWIGVEHWIAKPIVFSIFRGRLTVKAWDHSVLRDEALPQSLAHPENPAEALWLAEVAEWAQKHMEAQASAESRGSAGVH
jgi:hypothetical protein